LRAQLQDAKALKPVVPVMAEVPVEANAISDFVKRLAEIYKGLEIRANGNKIDISAPSTSFFSSFREAVIQVQNGGQNWKVGLESLCVGRECGQKQLSIALKVDRININQPESTRIDYQPGATRIDYQPGATKESE
jgi:hypothetical protein